MRIAGLPDLRTRSANTRSAGVAPARASTRNSTASAAEIAASVCSCMRPLRLSGAASSSPAVSTAVKARSPSCARPSRRSRVTPGRSSTKARRLPTRRLNSVDLPTFGRPTMATVKLMAKGSALWTPLYPRRQRRVQSARRGRIRPDDPAGRGLLLHRRRVRPLGLGLRLLLRRPNGDGGGARFVFRLGDDFWFRLGFRLGLGLSLGLGLVRLRLHGRLRLRFLDLLARLIALDQFLRHALRHPWRSLREHWLAFPRQPLLGVEKIRVHEGRRIEAFTTRQQDAERQGQDGEANARETIHPAPLNSGPRRRPAPSASPRGSAWRRGSAHPS